MPNSEDSQKSPIGCSLGKAQITIQTQNYVNGELQRISETVRKRQDKNGITRSPKIVLNAKILCRLRVFCGDRNVLCFYYFPYKISFDKQILILFSCVCFLHNVG